VSQRSEIISAVFGVQLVPQFLLAVHTTRHYVDSEHPQSDPKGEIHIRRSHPLFFFFIVVAI